MEFDSHSQCSDEGVEFSISESENGEIYLSDYPFLEDTQPSFLEAKTVYLLMQKDIPVSRSCRLQWLLDHLNTIITPSQKLNEAFNNLDVISAVPREKDQAVKCNKYLVTHRTEVKFLAQNYRFVYCLDMSPSHANVSVHKDEILFDEILNCFKYSIFELCKKFTIPGNSTMFQPNIFLTVIVNTPFFLSPAQQVLVKGVQIMQNNLQEILKSVEKQFHILQEKIVDACSAALDQLDYQRNNYDMPLEAEKMYSRIPMVTPDVNFVNMLRYSMLAVSLLPENSISHILVITDGVVAMPDSNIMESLLFQLHYDSIAISFLKVGSGFHPNSGSGFVSYTDLLQFFAYSTLGTCIENYIQPTNDLSNEMNVYHKLFLLWSFHSPNLTTSSRVCDTNKWTLTNETFCNHKLPSLLSKKQIDDNTSASILLLLSRRIREGFTIDSIFFLNGNLEIKLLLQWKSCIYIHYKVRAQWPILKNITHFEVNISAPYEFLHDITCSMKKESKSMYRQAIIQRFWIRLSQLSSGDLGIVAQQLSSFQNSKDWYTLPESVRNGIPVFVLNNSNCSDATKLTLLPSDVPSLKFNNMWQPICQMETNNWRKWFHVHKISLILQHDNPLPKYLHLSNSSQRYQVIQCRQAAASLNSLLSEWASFVLIDNHTYLKLLCKETDNTPMWFCMLRISSKFPCAVLNVGFTTGTPGLLRYEVCEQLKQGVASLCYFSPQKAKENYCCLLLKKPLEKILIRYERIPSNYSTVIFPDGTQPPDSFLHYPPVSGTLFTTLSRYLFHKRWIWSANLSTNPKLHDQSISRILNTLTRIRIKEGFSFAHSASGIITMVLEVSLDPTSTCLVQYVLFPPHCASVCEEIYSGSEGDNELSFDVEGTQQIITEVWIEPQHGTIVPGSLKMAYADNKHYYELADVIYDVDCKCINALLTEEHLNLMCQDRDQLEDSNHFNILFHQNSILSSTTSRKSFSRRSSRNSYVDYPMNAKGTHWYPIISPRIEHIPFVFNPISILHLCQQMELLFSMFTDTNENTLNDNNVDKANKLLLENILDHLATLHDHELELTKDDSDRFTKEIIQRHRNKPPNLCPLSDTITNEGDSQTNEVTCSKWRCFIKGISKTHVILTFIPSTLDDLKSLLPSDGTNIPSLNQSLDSADVDGLSSRESNYSDAPASNNLNELSLPIYVFDSPLGRIVNAFVDDCEEAPPNEDIYEDHRFKIHSFIHEEYIKLKSEEPCDLSKSLKDEYECDHHSLTHHSKILTVTHSKCFTSSLFCALHMGVEIHSFDVQSAMDQCEESITEIDITEYILTICAHVKQADADRIPIERLNSPMPCSDLKSLHTLIKEKFYKLLSGVFYRIPTNHEFYFYKNLKNYINEDVHVADSDDDVVGDVDDDASDNHSQLVEFKSEDMSIFSLDNELENELNVLYNFEMESNNEVAPLFLHLICTLRYDGGKCCNTSLRELPTCLGELIENLENPTEFIDKSNLQVTLDMLCLTLPSDLSNMIDVYSTQGFRTESFSSDFQASTGSATTDATYNSQISEPLNNLSEVQKKSVLMLSDEIKWLLQDEMCTALLDKDPVTTDTLDYVMTHVDQGTMRLTKSCVQDVIKLNFVYSTPNSYEKFVEEFANLKLPYSGYKLCKQDDLYYLAKDPAGIENSSCSSRTTDGGFANSSTRQSPFNMSNVNGFLNSTAQSNNRHMIYLNSDEIAHMKEQGQQSDISSTNESVPGTDGDYDEEVGDNYDYDWLISLNNRRAHLPNFWLIMKVAQDEVIVYFHCRFLELKTIQVEVYLEVQRAVCEAVRDLCKKINQLLLLQTLYDSKSCDPLLEPDDKDICNSPISRNPSYRRMKSIDFLVAENNEDNDMAYSTMNLSEASMNFKTGEFSCPVVWETPFILHPRLKTYPGKSGISRGVSALKTILDKFSVSDRTNMFVYRDNKQNVFYLRLQENVHGSSCVKSSLLKTSEFESSTVSRSPSIASLPHKSTLTQSQQSITSATSIDIRPRVRSFGEKECKDTPVEDTLILKVHGINEAGSDVQQELVQVLQNRLDDAVLECLSVMLARNAMCPLTPEDVHFIQKPFRPPEVIIRLTIQDFAFQWLQSFVYYLKQNLLQFLNVPKYTDNRPHCHFKDYSKSDENSDNIFIYNQSQHPSSGSRGIACIALDLIDGSDRDGKESIEFSTIFKKELFDNIVTSEIIDNEGALPHSYVEFRLWKQGRVNIENLSEKLKSAVSQATWDIITEYYLLQEPFCVENPENSEAISPIELESTDINLNDEVHFNCILNIKYDDNVRESVINMEKTKIEHLLPKRAKNQLKYSHKAAPPNENRPKENAKDKPHSKLNPYELGDKGTLSCIYSKYLPAWLEFGFNLNTPSVRKHKITLGSRHLPSAIIEELLVILDDFPKAFRYVPTTCTKSDEGFYVPFVASSLIAKYVVISRNLDHWHAIVSSCKNPEETPDFLKPHNFKHTQKFIPELTANSFIPRQKILWISVENDNIIIYAYNWAKDNIDKLCTSCNNLGSWLCVRSCFLNSVTSQKLGLFHNQPLIRKIFMKEGNPYANMLGNVEAMTSFSKANSSHKRTQVAHNLPGTLEAFRDNFKVCKYHCTDPVESFTSEMREMKKLEKLGREELKTLHGMYQSRTSTTSVSQLLLLLQNSRILHYCHTPLLFLPRWRLKTFSTRDHSLYPSQAIQLADKMASEEKELWHTELCYSFFQEYKHYMQTLGFMPLQIENLHKTGLWINDKSSHNNVFYIQKTILGGILIFTVEFSEPFFLTKLLAIECNRLQNINSRASINRFTLSFLDECDRVKILMHLHSFTYDYHLRSIHNYLSDVSTANKICDGYNVHQFLDDFLKYYNKAPNFARNLVHTETLTIENLVTEGKQLFDYLLRNVSQYDFKIVQMDVHDGESEFILIQVTSAPQISYKDSQDQQHTDDFDITLVVYNLCTPYSPKDNVLHLKYYLILTSKREIYPKSEVDEKLGKFRTVSSTARSLSALEREPNDLEFSTEKTRAESDITSSSELTALEKTLNEESASCNQQSISLPYVEINQEFVNYLGYYSSHEQLMQQLILDKATTTKKRIKEMVEKGMVHCRTHLLWNRLISRQESGGLTYEEFLELKNLARLEHLCNLNPDLGRLLNQPLNWYQNLSKLLLARYIEHTRVFNSMDGNMQHYVILHQEYFNAFMLLSLDLHTSRGELYAVYREPQLQEDPDYSISCQNSLIDGFINLICFFLWSGMISN
ncbi:unnamed protein product [Phyllotreta striolata]|uniref:KICSTOR complex protein SZT2 n=1 Tax=Phyllotreta striolata TaxID=444603 RepID=A0A9N9TGN3_PHYSR|nr:unnamed protein product [Phyllotreta striolata]